MQELLNKCIFSAELLLKKYPLRLFVRKGYFFVKNFNSPARMNSIFNFL